MKALVCRAFGPIESLSFEDLPAPAPGPGQVTVAVRACGVNFPDTLIVQGLYQFKPAFPFSPGAEIAGEVTAVGPDVTGLAPGDRIMAMMGWGGMAEAVAIDASRCVRLPPTLDMDTAASMPMVYGTSYHALKDRALLQPGETLLVLGAAGGVGLAAVQLGKAMGAKVIAAASTAEKLEACRESGAHHLIDYATSDLRTAIREITANKGVDVVFDPVGGPYSEPAFRSLAWRGRHLVVGFAAGDIPALPLNLALLKGSALTGVFFGQFLNVEPDTARLNFEEIVAMLGSGQIKPLISRRFPLSQGIGAIRLLADRGAIGKIVVTVP